eukprot:TRINITY_DN529_c2_g4_i1.p1 TRINITY_DN529_c2_g4~~TRINITY_DN529_c2_g4_i1.p1  ORF type:complete len:3442 (-),score=904.70 TRINITY_DN529_c2_g4_i1:98-9571(-)
MASLFYLYDSSDWIAQNDPELICEIAELLQVNLPAFSEHLRGEALTALLALCPRQLQLVIIAGGCASRRGAVPTAVRRMAASLGDPPSPEPWASRDIWGTEHVASDLLTLLWEVAGTESGAQALVSSGVVTTLVPLLQVSGPAGISICCNCVAIFRTLIRSKHRTSLLLRELGVLEIALHRERAELDWLVAATSQQQRKNETASPSQQQNESTTMEVDAAAPENLRTSIQPLKDTAASPTQPQEKHVVMASYAARPREEAELRARMRLARRLAKLLLALLSGSAAPAAPVRSGLATCLHIVLAHPAAASQHALATATQIMTRLLHQDPPQCHALLESEGVVRLFLSLVCGAAQQPLPARFITAAVAGLGATSLTAAGLQLVHDCGAFPRLLRLLTEPAYTLSFTCGQLRALAFAADELMRHQSSFKPVGIACVISMLEQLRRVAVDVNSHSMQDAKERETLRVERQRELASEQAAAVTALTAHQRASHIGATGMHYCGRRGLPPSTLCDGQCGPLTGTNCNECRRLDHFDGMLPYYERATVPGTAEYFSECLTNVLRFAASLLSHTEFAKTFAEQGGLQPLLSLCDGPLPRHLLRRRSPVVTALISLCGSLGASRPAIALRAIIARVETQLRLLDDVSPAWRAGALLSARPDNTLTHNCLTRLDLLQKMLAALLCSNRCDFKHPMQALPEWASNTGLGVLQCLCLLHRVTFWELASDPAVGTQQDETRDQRHLLRSLAAAAHSLLQELALAFTVFRRRTEEKYTAELAQELGRLLAAYLASPLPPGAVPRARAGYLEHCVGELEGLLYTHRRAAVAVANSRLLCEFVRASGVSLLVCHVRTLVADYQHITEKEVTTVVGGTLELCGKALQTLVESGLGLTEAALTSSTKEHEDLVARLCDCVDLLAWDIWPLAGALPAGFVGAMANICSRVLLSRDLGDRRTQPRGPPPEQWVQQLLELGFARVQVEEANARLSPHCSVERAADWLLRHPQLPQPTAPQAALAIGQDDDELAQAIALSMQPGTATALDISNGTGTGTSTSTDAEDDEALAIAISLGKDALTPAQPAVTPAPIPTLVPKMTLADPASVLRYILSNALGSAAPRSVAVAVTALARDVCRQRNDQWAPVLAELARLLGVEGAKEDAGCPLAACLYVVATLLHPVSGAPLGEARSCGLLSAVTSAARRAAKQRRFTALGYALLALAPSCREADGAEGALTAAEQGELCSLCLDVLKTAANAHASRAALTVLSHLSRGARCRVALQHEFAAGVVARASAPAADRTALSRHRRALAALATSVLRHLAEDRATLEGRASQAVAAAVARGRAATVPQLLQVCAPVVARDPDAFMRALGRTCTLRRQGADGHEYVSLRKRRDDKYKEEEKEDGSAGAAVADVLVAVLGQTDVRHETDERAPVLSLADLHRLTSDMVACYPTVRAAVRERLLDPGALAAVLTSAAAGGPPTPDLADEHARSRGFPQPASRLVLTLSALPGLLGLVADALVSRIESAGEKRALAELVLRAVSGPPKRLARQLAAQLAARGMPRVLAGAIDSLDLSAPQADAAVSPLVKLLEQLLRHADYRSHPHQQREDDSWHVLAEAAAPQDERDIMIESEDLDEDDPATAAQQQQPQPQQAPPSPVQPAVPAEEVTSEIEVDAEGDDDDSDEDGDAASADEYDALGYRALDTGDAGSVYDDAASDAGSGSGSDAGDTDLDARNDAATDGGQHILGNIAVQRGTVGSLAREFAFLSALATTGDGGGRLFRVGGFPFPLGIAVGEPQDSLSLSLPPGAGESPNDGGTMLYLPQPPMLHPFHLAAAFPPAAQLRLLMPQAGLLPSEAELQQAAGLEQRATELLRLNANADTARDHERERDEERRREREAGRKINSEIEVDDNTQEKEKNTGAGKGKFGDSKEKVKDVDMDKDKEEGNVNGKDANMEKDKEGKEKEKDQHELREEDITRKDKEEIKEKEQYKPGMDNSSADKYETEKGNAKKRSKTEEKKQEQLREEEVMAVGRPAKRRKTETSEVAVDHVQDAGAAENEQPSGLQAAVTAAEPGTKPTAGIATILRDALQSMSLRLAALEQQQAPAVVSPPPSDDIGTAFRAALATVCPPAQTPKPTSTPAPAPATSTPVHSGNPAPVIGLPPIMDPLFLAELPEDLRMEVLAQQLSAQTSDAPVRNVSVIAGEASAATSRMGPDPAILAQLPADIQEELLQEQQRVLRESERAAASQPADLSHAEDMDTASIIATLTPDLREEALLSIDDAALETLPPALAAEANAVRDRASRGFLARHLAPPQQSPATGGAHHDRKQHVKAALELPVGPPPLRPTDVAALLRLLYVDSPRVQLQQAMEAICLHPETREALVRQLLVVVCANVSPEPGFAYSPRFSPAEQPSHPLLGLHPGAWCCTRAVTARPPPLVCRRIVDCLSHLVGAVPPVGDALVTGFQSHQLKDKQQNEGECECSGSLPALLSLLTLPPFADSVPHLDRLVYLLSLLASRVDHERRCPRVSAIQLRRLVGVLCHDGLSDDTLRSAAAVIARLADHPANRAALIAELDYAARVLFERVADALSALCTALARLNGPTPSTVEARFAGASPALAHNLLRVVCTHRDLLAGAAAEYRAQAQQTLASLFTPLWRALGVCLDSVTVLERTPSDVAASAIHSTPNLSSVLQQQQRAPQRRGAPSTLLLLPIVQLFFMLNCPHEKSKQQAEQQRQLQQQQLQVTPVATTTGAGDEVSESEFHSFAEKYRSVLNRLVRENPSLLSAGGGLEVLLRTPRLLDFDNKRTHFRLAIQRVRELELRRLPTVRLTVRRSNIFEDSFHSLRTRTAAELKGRMSVQFSGEEGIDAGGLTKEWYQVISREMFNPNYALFKLSDDGAYQPNPASHVNADHLDFFKFIGRVVGKALFGGQLLDVHFTRSFYKHMLGQKVTVRDMDSVDHAFYKNLQFILENNLADVGVELTFSCESEVFGRMQVVDLKPKGRSIAVTDENKVEYVRLLVEHKLTTSISKQIESFLAGFHDLVSPELIAAFNEKELELLISGMPEIDLDDLRANTEYHGYTADSPQIDWFWSAAREMNPQERAELLQFVTGSSKVPLDGFAALSGMHGITRFSIHKTYRADGLPTAHTCFNQLDLPEYSSYEVLRRCLLTAVREGCEGFGFG